MNRQHEPSELINTVLTNARWATYLKLFAQLFRWLSTLIVIRLLDPTDYGLNAMLESPMGLMLLLSTVGLDVALVHAKEVEKNKLQGVFGTLLLVNGLLFLLYFYGSTLLANYYEQPELDALGKALAFVFLVAPFRVIPNALLDRELNFRLRAQLELASSLLSAAITVVLAYADFGVWALVLGALSGAVSLAVLHMVYHPWIVIPRLNWREISPLMRLGGLFALTGVVMRISEALIPLMAGPKIGVAMLGVFFVAQQLASMPMTKLMPAINPTIIPTFAKLQDDKSQATYYFEKLLLVSSVAFLPMLVGIAVTSGILVDVVLGEKWSDSELALALFALGMPIKLAGLLFRQVITALGHGGYALTSCIVHLVVMASLLTFVPEFDLLGLVGLWIITESIVALVTLFFVEKAMGFDIKNLVRGWTPAFVASSIMGCLVWGLLRLTEGLVGWIELVSAVIFGALVYYYILRLFFVSELKVVHKVIFGAKLKFLSP